MRNKVILVVNDCWGFCDEMCVNLQPYGSIDELLVTNLVYAYFHGSSDGTVFSEDGGVLIRGKKFESVLVEYTEDLRYDGLLQFVRYALEGGIDAGKIERVLKRTHVQTFSDQEECMKYLERCECDYVFRIVSFPESLTLSGRVECVDSDSALGRFMLSLCLGEQMGCRAFGYGQFDALCQYLEAASITTYDQFCSIVDILHESCGWDGYSGDFKSTFELCLLHRLYGVQSRIGAGGTICFNCAKDLGGSECLIGF